MKREDLEAILGVDTGQIADHVRALGAEDRLPNLALAVCTARIEEAAPLLLEALASAADGDLEDEKAAMLVFRGLHVLGSARVQGTWPLLARLLRRPHDELEHLLGDAITESLSKIVVGVFDGDPETLFEMITDPLIDEFVRDALLGAAAFMTWEGRLDLEEMTAFLRRLFWMEDVPWEDQVWSAWQDAIALLGLRDLKPLVQQAWREERLPDGVADPAYFETTLLAAERAPADIARFERAHLGYISDVIPALEWTDHMVQHDRKADFDRPVINPWRDIGRNDPCPCGSGRKAKKCCLSR